MCVYTHCVLHNLHYKLFRLIILVFVLYNKGTIIFYLHYKYIIFIKMII